MFSFHAYNTLRACENCDSIHNHALENIVNVRCVQWTLSGMSCLSDQKSSVKKI